MGRRLTRATALLAGSLLVCACGSVGGDTDDRVTIELFQFKPEAVQTFDAIIADFEAEHPGIDVQQNHVPDASTAIRTRLVRDDVPDVITLNGDDTFGELASAGVFHDFSDDPVLDDVSAPILEILNELGVHEQGQVNGVPFASNASGILYNKQLFEQHGVEVPRTWDELMAVCRTFERAGVLPIYATLQEAWTALPTFNAVAANVQPDRFYDELRADDASFAATYPDVARRVEQLLAFAQDDRMSSDYNTGNQAFARGEAAMYSQGSFTIPAIRTFEPDFDIGSFAMPADTASETELLTGVDVALTMGAEPEHPEQSMELIEYLMTPEVVERYAAEQSALPTIEGTTPDDPALSELRPYLDSGRLAGYPDHQISPAIPLEAIIQQFLIDGDEEAFLSTLDEEWDKVARRQL